MDDTVWGYVITAIVTLVGIFISAKTTRDQVSHKLDTNQQLMNGEIQHIKSEMGEMKQDIKEHNNYARMFSESIPVIQEQLKNTDRRVGDLEETIKASTAPQGFLR